MEDENIAIDSDEDTETQLKDIIQLTEVLKADEVSQQAAANISSVASTSTAVSANQSNELSKIETALALNKLTDDKYKRLEKILENRLAECRSKIEQNTQKLNTTSNTKEDVFRYYSCGKPYFRDRTNCAPPDNDDTILMRQLEMYDFSNVLSGPGWTVKDKAKLIRELTLMSQDIRRKEINSKISKLTREGPIKNSQSIALLKKEIDSLKKKPLSELALPINQDYDWETLANKLENRHTPQEYRNLWRLFFHPSINKSIWTKEEHMQLQKIADANRFEDWELITQQLDTKRTAYQCFVYYRTNMNSVFSGRKWTTEETEYLKRLIEYYREDNYIPWGKVAAGMGNRTKIQIYNKYSRLLEKRKGRFLPEEDTVILNLLKKFGPHYKKMTNYLPGRSLIQIRNRCHVLSKMRISTVWSVEDDRKLLQLMANQEHNSDYSLVAKYLPGKDRTNIRTRYMTLVRWMQRNPHLDISIAPRRAARRLNHGVPTNDLNKALENLKTKMETELETKKKKKYNLNENEIHDAVLAVFVTEALKNQEEEDRMCEDSDLSISNASKNTDNLYRVLILLNAKLDKNKFRDSEYAELYPELINFDPRRGMGIHVKSYSRKTETSTSSGTNNSNTRVPNIWGSVTLGALNYVLPPNFSTITGARVLMNHINKYPVDTYSGDLNLVMRKNPNFRKQFLKLLERFVTLELWVMRLTNEFPANLNHRIKHQSKRKESTSYVYEPPLEKRTRCADVTEPPIGIAIPRINRSEPEYSITIDLDESEQNEDININVDKSFLQMD